MKQACKDLMDFHKACGLVINHSPTIPDVATVTLRVKLIEEEIAETLAGIRDADMEEIADGIADSIYVLIGAAVSYGIPLPAIWDEVQRANMQKSTGPRREDGKILKPAGWTPPNIVDTLKNAGWGG